MSTVIPSAASASASHLTKIFVYGTLKSGFPNHPLLSQFLPSNDAIFLGNYLTHQPFPLVLGPLGVPFLIHLPGSGHRVKGELYSVSSTALAALDELEGVSVGHYERLPVEVVGKGGDVGVVEVVEAYFADRSYGERMWEKSGRVGMEEYLDKDGEMYVRVKDRDVGKMLGDYIRSYLQS